jgi:hypothetical protein
MTKVLNQLLYSSVVFGDELPGGVLRLESTSSGTKGAVEVVGTHVDIINGTIGRLVHTNSSLQIYDFPDYSGQVLISGLFTAPYQMVYSSAAGVYAMLPNSPSGALVTLPSGALQWATGLDGQVLTLVAGVPGFTDLPDVGFINPSPLGDQVAYYATAGNDLSPITTIASRALLSSATGTLSWALLEATYLKAAGGLALGAGVATQVLTAVGDGSFAWVNANPSLINPGTQYRLPYYSATSLGTVVSSSSFLQTDETFRSLGLLNRGTIRFYEATANGTDYLEFKAPLSFGPSVSWTLPSTDGLPGALLQTDGFGNLSLNIVDNGTVNPALANQVAYYVTTGNDVSGLTTTSARILGSTVLGTLSWMLIKESYLSTTGDTPLGSGTLNQVLVSDGATNFLWANAVDITGEVLSGVATYLAFYPATGTKVDDTSFLSIDNTLNIFNLLTGAKLRFFPASGTNYVEFQAPSLAASASWILPAIDGLNGYALTTDGAGVLSFIEVGRGVVNIGTPMTLAYYPIADDAVSPWTNVASRVALTTAINEINWGLITTEYLSGAGGVPLDLGTPNYALTPDGFGSFLWVDMITILGKVNPALSQHLAFYAFDGNQVYGSLWLNNAELSKALELQDGGSLRFYIPGTSFYAALLASPTMAANVTWYLPLTDASLSGQALVSDAAGQLSFVDLVDPGVQDAVATYQNSTARRVSPSTTFFNPATGLLLKGLTFDIVGDSGVAPTIVSLKSGDNTAGAGANLYLASGVGTTAAGTAFIGAGANNYLSVEDGGWISALLNASLRFYDTGVNYVGFKAPTTVTTSQIWTLPPADGLAGQFLWTDGLGVLTWVTNRINTGILNAIPYYSALNELSASTLLIPTGLPITDGNTLLVDKTTGQLSYAVTVEPLGTAGQIAVYTAAQTVGYYADLTWDDLTKLVQIGTGGGLSFFETTNTFSTTLRASSDLTASTALTLPPDLPVADGYVLTGESDGTLLFRAPSSDTRWEKRGVVTLRPGARSVTVIYDTPFSRAPLWVNTQWVIGDNSSYLPTYAVDKSTVTAEGFIVRVSTQIPTTGTYSLNWHSYLDAVVTYDSKLFIAGGCAGSGYLDSLVGMVVDNETLISIAGTLSSPRGYTCGGGSSVYGYIFGGSSPIPLPLNIITSYAYVTSVLTDLSTTLITARSGAAGVGTRSTAYVAGGETPGGASFSSVENFDTATETISGIGATLANPSVSAGTATSSTKGAIVHSGLTSMELLTYTTETFATSAATFGATDISVGANDVNNSKAYFGRDAGYVYVYSFGLDTLTVLPASLNSATGLSSAGNSLDRAYFAGSQLIDALDFSTGTVQTVSSLIGAGHMSAASSTFQSKGLL